jgi:hypothetical protein
MSSILRIPNTIAHNQINKEVDLQFSVSEVEPYLGVFQNR